MKMMAAACLSFKIRQFFWKMIWSNSLILLEIHEQ